MRTNPQPLQLYRHFKGNIYQIKSLAIHSETGEPLVIYQAMYGDFSIYARPLEMFMSEVDHAKYPNVSQRYRFELVETICENGNQTETKSEPAVPAGLANEAVTVLSEATDKNKDDSYYDEVDIQLDPQVEAFLDCSTFEQRLEILSKMHMNITDEMINIMAISLDLEITDGDIEQRYQELRKCLLTLDHFECDRLR